MISREEIVKLANLSRLKLSEEEILHMQVDITSILSYVDKLKGAKDLETGPIMSTNKNVLREDVNAHESGIYTEKLINLAPQKEKTSEGQFVKVKKVL